jgi:hypothetical protein
MQTTSTTVFTGFSTIDVALFLDGAILANGGYVRVVVSNTGITGLSAYWAFTTAPIIPAGSHTITIRARGNGAGQDATVAGNNASYLQGEVNLTVLKQ